MKYDKKIIKRIIENYEEGHTGLYHINGAYVNAINIKVGGEKVYADIKLVKQLDGITERINDCEYPLIMFEEAKE